MKRRKRGRTKWITGAALVLLAGPVGGYFALRWISPPMAPYLGQGMAFRYPAGWKVRASEHPPYLRTFLIEPGDAPPLRIEEHLGPAVTPTQYAEGMEDREGPVRELRLGRRRAVEVRTRDPGRVAMEPHSARILAPEEGMAYLFKAKESLFIASHAQPAGVLQRWRLRRLYRRVLASIEKKEPRHGKRNR